MIFSNKSLLVLLALFSTSSGLAKEISSSDYISFPAQIDIYIQRASMITAAFNLLDYGDISPINPNEDLNSKATYLLLSNLPKIQNTETNVFSEYLDDIKNTRQGKEFIDRVNNNKSNLYFRLSFNPARMPDAKELLGGKDGTFSGIESRSPRDLYGLTSSDGKRALIVLRNDQSKEQGLFTLIHELFHLFDPALKSLHNLNDNERELIAEYRAYLAEIQFFSILEVKSNLPVFYEEFSKKLKAEDHKTFTKNLLARVLDNKFPIQEEILPKYIIDLEKAPELFTPLVAFDLEKHGNNIDTQKPEVLLNEIAKLAIDQNKEIIVRAFYTTSSDVKQKIISENKEIRRKLDVTNIAAYILKNKLNEINELLPSPEINSFTSGGPKSRDSGS
ncbi:MAG: hypothetical protein HY843_01775 [Bdellovibrio sp.]|nr:hypothetical protein [Bdellovibrio sp.]